MRPKPRLPVAPSHRLVTRPTPPRASRSKLRRKNLHKSAANSTICLSRIGQNITEMATQNMQNSRVEFAPHFATQSDKSPISTRVFTRSKFLGAPKIARRRYFNGHLAIDFHRFLTSKKRQFGHLACSSTLLRSEDPGSQFDPCFRRRASHSSRTAVFISLQWPTCARESAHAKIPECFSNLRGSSDSWRYRLGVRTPDSQSGNPGSIPGTATNSDFLASVHFPLRLSVTLERYGANLCGNFRLGRFYLEAEILSRESKTGSLHSRARKRSEGSNLDPLTMDERQTCR
jgi:hypothetical protein